MEAVLPAAALGFKKEEETEPKGKMDIGMIAKIKQQSSAARVK